MSANPVARPQSIDLLAAIEAHRLAHERQRQLQDSMGSLPGSTGHPDWPKADEEENAAREALTKARNCMASITPRSAAELGTLAAHMQAMMAVDRAPYGDAAEVNEAFDDLVSACSSFAGAAALKGSPSAS